MSINDRLDAIGTITMEDQDELAEVIDNNFEFEDYRPTFNEAGEITGSNVADAIRALGYRKMTITTAAELDAIEARADEVAEWRKHFRAPQNRMDYSQRDVYVLLDLARKQQAALDAVKALHKRTAYGDCAECTRQVEESISGDGQYSTVQWPCPTIAAITGKGGA